MATSPFKVMGLDPSVLRGLTDFQIQDLVRAAFRVLAPVYHPDTGGSDRKFQGLQQAKDELDKPERFAYWKKLHLKKQRYQLQALEDEVEQKEAGRILAENRLCDFWSSAVKSDSLSAYCMSRVRILLADVIELAVRQLQRFVTRSGFNEPAPKGREVEVNELGEVWEYSIKRVRFKPLQQKPPDLPDGWVYESRVPGGGNSYYVVRSGEGRLLPGMRLIGSINRDTISPRARAQRTFTALMPHEDYSGVNPAHGFSWEMFRQYAVHLDPEIKKNQVLVGVFRREGEVRFSILGNILAIHIL